MSSISIPATTRGATVKAADKIQVTLGKSFWQSNGIFTEFWNRATGASYSYTVSAPPSGAKDSAVIDIAVNQQGAGKTVGQIVDDLYNAASGLWGPDITDARLLKLSDMRSSVAPARRASAEVEADIKAAQANPLNRLFSVIGSLGTVAVVVVIVAALWYFGAFAKLKRVVK